MAAGKRISDINPGYANGEATNLKKLGEWYRAAARAPGAVLFDAEEAERLEFANLVLLGIPPSEIETLEDYRKWDIFEIAAANEELRWGGFKKK